MHAHKHKKISFIAELVSCFASISEGLYVSKLKPAPAANKRAGGTEIGKWSQASGWPEVSDRFVGFRWFVVKMEWVPRPNEPPGQK